MEPSASVRVSRESLGQKVADLLRRRILAGELPVGARLVEDELSAQLGTSRGPLRDAFSLLAREGLLATTQGKGTYVKGLTPDSLRQLYEVRTILEVHASRQAAGNAEAGESAVLVALVDRMGEAARRGDQRGYVAADVALHRAIWRLSGNDHLVGLLEYLITPCATLIAMNAESRYRWPIVVEYHQRLVNSVSSGQVDEAGHATRALLGDSLDVALAIIDDLRNSKE